MPKKATKPKEAPKDELVEESESEVLPEGVFEVEKVIKERKMKGKVMVRLMMEIVMPVPRKMERI